MLMQQRMNNIKVNMAGSYEYRVEKARSSDNVRKIEDLCSSYQSAVQLVSSELSLFQTKDQGYRVILEQEDTKCKTFQAYTLFTSKQLDCATEGFSRLRQLLDPLLEDCTLFLTEEILAALVKYEPMDPSQFITRMEENGPSTNPALWNKVIEVLVIDAMSTGNDEVAQTLTASLLKHTSLRRDNDKRVESDGIHTIIMETLPTKISSYLSSILNRSKDGDGKTELMKCIQKNDLKRSFALLRGGADVNIVNEKDGNTALHYAVQTQNNVTFTKLLLSYRASMDIKNKNSQTALQLSKERNSAAYQYMKHIKDLTDQAVKYSHPKKLSNDGLCLLCLDGGGSRAVIACQILKAIEEKMKQLSPTCGPLTSYFDYIAGTSAGGITALSLVHAEVSIDSSLTLSLKVIDKSFKSNPPSPTENTKAIEGCLKDHFTHDLTMVDVTQPRVMIMTTLVDRHPPALHIFRNYGNEPRDRPPLKTKVWEAARATSAAPAFFHYFDKKCADGSDNKCADGGLMANNPTLAALTELFTDKSSQPKRIGMVLSVGTGTVVESTDIQHSGIHMPGGSIQQLIESISKVGNTLKEIKQLWELFVTQTTRADGHVVSTANAWCNSIGADYVRLSPTLPEKLYSNFATVNEIDLTDMMYEGLKYALEEYKTVDRVARFLLLRGPQPK